MRAYNEAHREQSRANSRANRAANLEEIRAKDRIIAKRRNALPHVVALKAAWIDRNPEKAKAQAILQKAVERRKIKKPKACSQCSEEGRLEAHHDDYSKPLEVIWLCRICHVKQHKGA